MIGPNKHGRPQKYELLLATPLGLLWFRRAYSHILAFTVNRSTLSWLWTPLPFPIQSTVKHFSKCRHEKPYLMKLIPDRRSVGRDHLIRTG